MKYLIKKLKQFHTDEEGTTVETGLIYGIMAVIAIGGLVYVGPKIKAMFTKGGTALDQGAAVNY